ncbi:hypothetical protein AMTRI_Chr04g188980 [Amborella trichopoda]
MFAPALLHTSQIHSPFSLFPGLSSFLSPLSLFPNPSKQKVKLGPSLIDPTVFCNNPTISQSTVEELISHTGYEDYPYAWSSGYNCADPSLLLPNNLAYMLQSCVDSREGKLIHSLILKHIRKPVVFIDNNLINMYMKFGEFEIAQKVFDRMHERNIVSWTSLLNGYLKIGFHYEAICLFCDLARENVRPNSHTYVCLLNLCGKKLHFELGLQIHACIFKGNLCNLIVDSALVYFYSQCGDLMGAFQVFDRMPQKDSISWTTMISAYTNQGYGKDALYVFSQMQLFGFRPNEFTISCALKACGQEEALNNGKQLHAYIIKRVFKDDVFVGSSLVYMYSKCGRVSEARHVFNGMPRRNTVTWTSMVAGYAQNGFGKEAISLFRKMRSRRVIANDLTVVCILSACGLVESLDNGKEIHGQILKKFRERNIYIDSTLVWFYCRCGEYEYASKVLKDMPFRDVVSWTSIISGCALLGYGSEALKFLNDMLWEGIEPNQFTFSSAIKACAKLQALRHGKKLHAYANKTHALSNVYVGSALIGMYAKCGSMVDARRIFDMMEERNVVSWKVMMMGYARNGLFKEAMKLLYRMKEEGVEVDEFVMTTVLNACGEAQSERESVPS